MKDIDRARLFEILEKMDSAAKSQQRICVIGAAALILLGQPARQTGDVDIWRPGSKLLDAELREIAAAAGLAYNPTDYEPEGAYLQIINPGIVNLPEVDGDVWVTREQSRILWQGQNITVVCPPPPIIAAAKLVRATDVDLDDVVYLIGAVGVTKRQITTALTKFPEPDRQFAKENIRLVEEMLNQAEQRQRQRGRDGDQR